MSRRFGIIVLSAFLLGGGAVHAYELIEVVNGDEILVLHEGRRVVLELAGVWVPEVPRSGYAGDYRGVEAREYVEKILYSEPVFIREVEPPAPGDDRVKVRIRVGEAGDYDLAVSLAHEGLGLFMEASGVEDEYLEAIYRAERVARRAARGMHDGGYETHRRAHDRSVVSFGFGVVGASPAARGYRAYASGEGADGGSSGRSESADRPRVRSAVQGIRDWGSQMGLPRDRSAWGR